LKRGTLLLAAAAAAVAALAVLPGRASTAVLNEVSPHGGCTPVTAGTLFETPNVEAAGTTVVAHNFHGYLYCGYRWASYPIRFKVESAGIPPIQGTSPTNKAAMFTNAVKAASAEWNKYWPPKPSSSTSCADGVLLCNDQNATGLIVRFGALGAGVVGQAAVYAPSGKTITAVVVTLNSSLTWRIASGADLVTGEAPGVLGSACRSLCGSWFDVQDVLTHELGHAISLEDLGNQSQCGADVLEAIDYGETMYGCLKSGDTSKRTLGFGDQLGLARLAQDY
jgi:hypothetical protein